jgi:hypothetical protein
MPTLNSTYKFSVWCTHEPPEPPLLPLSESQSQFNKIAALNYEHARIASIDERKHLAVGEKMGALVYGEVTFDSMRKILKRAFDLRSDPEVNMLSEGDDDLIFCDLGSGAGRPVFASACCYPFKKSVGVELLSSLHDLALRAKQDWDANVDLSHKTTIEFYHGNIFDLSVYDWTGADIILVNSTCFTDVMMRDLSVLAKIRPSCIMITFTQALESSLFEVIGTNRWEMSWGEADVYYHKRL